MAIRCDECGATLPRKTRLGLCPRCLLTGALTPAPDETEPAPVAAAESAPRVAADAGLRFSIPGHVVTGRLARGGMGMVYRARQLDPAREVALKVMQPSAWDAPEIHQRFKQEAQTLAMLDHPGILPVYAFGERDGLPWFTMKLAAGGTLAQRRGELAGQWHAIARLVASLCDAVQYAHDRGVLHRDLKPGNVLFDEANRPYVADFGLAKLLEADTDFTQSLAVLGTPHYLAPEIAAHSVRHATVASDLYGLGAILYELLAGRPPFLADGVPGLLRQIAESEPLPPSHWTNRSSGRSQTVPRDLDAVCLTCLAKDPRQRYATARDLALELRRWLQGEPVSARQAGPTERLWRWARRNRKLAFALASVAVLGVLLIAILYLGERREARLSAQVRLNLYAADMALAGTAIERDTHEQARSILARHVPARGQTDLRGLEWGLLHHLAQGDSPRGFMGHTETVTGVAASPDGTRIFSASRDGTLREWDLASGAELRVPALPQTQDFHCLHYDPQRRQLIAGDGHGLLAVWWDLASGSVRQFTNGPMIAAAIAPEGDGFLRGETAAFYSNSGGMAVVDFHGVVRRTVPDTGNRFAFSPDGQRLATGSWRHRVRLWRWPEMVLLRDLGPMEATVSLDFSPDGRLLVSSGFNGELKLWDTEQGRQTQAVKAHRGTTVGCARFSPDGKWLATAGGDQVLCVWDARTLELKKTLRGRADQVWSLAWTADGQALLSTSRRHGLRYWPLRPSAIETSTNLYSAHPLLFSPDGRWLALNLAGETGAVLADASGAEHRRFTNDFVVVGFAENGSALWGTDLRRARLLRLSIPDFVPGSRDGIPLEDPAGLPPASSRMRLFPGERHLLINQLGQDLRIYETSSGRLARKIPISRSSDTGVAILDATRFVLSSPDGSLNIHRLDTGTILARLRGHGAGPLNLAVNPQRTRFASADWDGRLRVWDAHTYRLLFEISAFDGAGPMAFSSDGGTLAKADLTHVHFVHLATRRSEATLPFPLAANDTLAIAPADRALALIDRSGHLRLWPAAAK